ncbi:MAG: DUF1997 domain-containing protein, partial [Hylemonella sp.]
MVVEKNVPLQPYNSFGIVARAQSLVRLASQADAQALAADPGLAALPKFVLGGGSNIVLTGDVRPLVLKVEIMGRQLVADTPKAWVVEAGAGESWHELVRWTLELTVWIRLPSMITLLPDGLVQSSGAHLLRQIVRQISR